MSPSIADHPNLLAAWHPTRNGSLAPEDVSAAAEQLLWWHCPRGPDHEWQASPKYRGAGCPFCKNRRVCADNSLAAVRPDLAAEWHPTKNGPLRPCDLVFGSARTVWWQCERRVTHQWQAKVRARSGRATGCPYCIGHRVDAENSLAAKAPHIAAQWHPTKNGTLTPADLTAGSRRKVWWRCPKGKRHEWCAAVSARAHHGCPVCARRKATERTSLAARRPKVAAEWHPEKNGALRPQNVVPGSTLKLWWRCKAGSHEFQMRVRDRSAGAGCPACAGRPLVANRKRTDSIAAEAPDIAAQWHPTRNGERSPHEVRAGSCKRFWWKCPLGPDHEWQAKPEKRVTDRGGCPFCCNRRLSVTNSLAALRPVVAELWHPTRNGSLTPRDVMSGSYHQAWWRCSRNPRHAWRLAVRAARRCPYCSHRKTPPEDSLARCAPRLAREWHPTKNGSLRPTDVVPGSHRRVWWKCPKGPDHEWHGVISRRTRDNARCPFCVGKHASVTNSLAIRFPAIAQQWHPTANAPLTAADILPSSSQCVWWHCSNGPDHQWYASPGYRTRSGRGCPFCRNHSLSVTNCLATRYPRIAARWHPTKNAPLTPRHVFPSDRRTVWWRCERGHEWQALVTTRTRKQGGCPICHVQPARSPVTRRRTREHIRLHSDYRGV